VPFTHRANRADPPSLGSQRLVSQWTKLGAIVIGDDNLLWLGDPALAPIPDEGTVVQVQSSTLDIFYESIEFGGDTRVSRLRICSDGQLGGDPVLDLGTVWTDTALLTAVSPAFFGELETHRARGALDERLGRIDLVGSVSLQEPLLELLVVSTGFGDGEYPLRSGLGPEGTLLEVTFITPDEPYPFDP